ncbi:MAG: tRNA (adenosine(37)-N6)-threonylcarbamoyltransferase complex transferase subunit TsaD [Hydrogenothermaceae bacterium]|nr:tRNA (adenosine(37)-N6)-threonylcarbamoyltransferase complex transferase subunit TsaD [Hydrogenothermaceae bacterium]
MLILAVESSCDDTSVAVYHSQRGILSNVVSSQVKVHQEWGGVFPELAAREHTRNFLFVVDRALKDANIDLKEIDAVATTFCPGLIISLVVGVSGAKTIAYILDKPLIPVHHIEAHIFANFIRKEQIDYPFIALVVSGGHTELVLVRDFEDYIYLGGTLDDAVGEVYDKVARALGLEFPGGPIIDRLSKEGKESVKLPRPLIHDKEENRFNFSFSGLKSATIREIQKGIYLKEDIAASFQNAAVEVLVKKSVDACQEFNVKSLVVAGGVSANSRLREVLTKECKKQGINLSIPPIYLCTDNAAMVAYTGYLRYMKTGRTVSYDFEALAKCRIDRFKEIFKTSTCLSSYQ